MGEDSEARGIGGLGVGEGEGKGEKGRLQTPTHTPERSGSLAAVGQTAFSRHDRGCGQWQYPLNRRVTCRCHGDTSSSVEARLQ